MPKKRASKRSGMRGGAWYDDVWSGIKSVAEPVNSFLKNTKVISKVGGLIPDGRAKIAAGVADQLGYGRRRMRGRGARSVIFV